MTALAPPRTLIRLDDQGRPWVEGTTLKVMEVVLAHLANGWGPEEIFEELGRRIPLAGIYAALAYYYDNRAAFDAQIEADDREYERLRREAGESPFAKRMREQGSLT